ncbi:hypothetical protein NIES4074_41170 [Cylindrospermum sp. NIES-4074]|nr:hypothetical protein NIES4074_41170 [Cylindrospermum sp. NIES-4074]
MLLGWLGNSTRSRDGSEAAGGDGAYVAKACCIQQAFTVLLARFNHAFRMVGQQHPRSDRLHSNIQGELST